MIDSTAVIPRGKTPLAATLLIFVASAVLLFTRLGHYALWDDEALTAMTATNVARTGDTSVWVGDHNIMAYRNGLLVKDFHDRYTPPLQFYVIAPFVGFLGDSSFVCRLPMAICGLITVALILRWMWKINPPPLVWWSAAFALLTNVSFFIFFRQCRYYGLATMLTTAAAFLYCTGRSRRSIVGLSVVLFLLLATQYLNYIAVIGCLCVDYLIWGRKTRPLELPDWLILIIPQLIVGGFVCSIWNPVARQGGAQAYQAGSFFADRLHLFWWNWRDMVACDFVILPLLLVCPLLYFVKPRRAGAGFAVIPSPSPGTPGEGRGEGDLERRSGPAEPNHPHPNPLPGYRERGPERASERVWLLRTPTALVVYIAMISTFVATAVAQAGNAEVRYLAPAAPLCVAIAIVAVWGTLLLPVKVRRLILCISVLSTLLVPTPANTVKIQRPTIGSSTIEWWHELARPIDEPYTPLIAWINDPKNMPPGSSVYIQPGYMAYPLMLRCPQMIYAWQLDDPRNPQPVPKGWYAGPVRTDFANMPDIHFHGRVPPDFMIAAGTEQSSDVFNSMAKIEARHIWMYKRVAVLHYYWKDLYRPELIWRSFVTKTVPPGDDNADSIFIFQRVPWEPDDELDDLPGQPLPR
jgi:4-amino-4-deoxy-L-arabinose transferase-like glycosyltransferase